MNKIIEIKQNDFVKYLKSIYLVKDFKKIEDGKYKLHYYFRSIIKDNAKLHKNNFDKLYSFSAEKIKKANSEEVQSLITKIKTQYPNFDLTFVKSEKIKNSANLKVEDCIEFLKSKGYIIYKQV